MTIYLTASDILEINEKFVGSDQLRDFGLLDGAVMRPQTSAFGEDAFPSIHEKAAALLHGLARNHPFVTGNKRTAWTATAMFYMVNGCNLHVEAADILRLTTDAAEGQIGVQDIAASLKDWAQPFPTSDDWIDTARDVFASSRDGVADSSTEIEQEVEAQIAEFGESIRQWEYADELDHDIRQQLAKLRESIDGMAEARLHLHAAGYTLSDDAIATLRQTHQGLLDLGRAHQFPPEWEETVNAHPAFAGLGEEHEHRSRGAQQRKSSGAQQRKFRGAQQRKSKAAQRRKRR